MVLIAAAICTKSGKTIVSRQFVEMTRARIEGLLAAFPKLMSSGKQHTFVETDSVRYVYQPLEKLYMLLITTKTSNILEDLETLRLFSRVIPEYCRTLDEAEVTDNAFSLIFAFDEIVALGYRESVNLAQVRTFVEMDSHEEKVYQAVRKTQEREAENKMREKAKELKRQRMESVKKFPKTGISGGSSNPYFSSSSYSSSSAAPVLETSDPSTIRSSYISQAQKPALSAKAMKLGSKSHDVESFVDQLKSEGEKVISGSALSKVSSLSSKIPSTNISNMDSVHLRQEEQLIISVGRNGGIEAFELHGLLTLRISDEKYGKIKVLIIIKTHVEYRCKLIRTWTRNYSNPKPRSV
uniref:Coatomer subunit delta n=1 Tax=Cacopsylla melanoneura TaxID=428564 RepID=A0A8D9AF55_9HEMI